MKGGLSEPSTEVITDRKGDDEPKVWPIKAKRP
jgi:hypothetical protein